jgi:hypothetical protein
VQCSTEIAARRDAELRVRVPTKDRRWERARAEVYSDAIGSSVVVANSLVIAEILQESRPVGTAIAIAPGCAAVRHSSEPDHVVVFALDGDRPRVEYERVRDAR